MLNRPSKIKRYKVIFRDKQICGYCGRRYPLDRLTVDHINPIARGGDNKPTNLVCACFDCNLSKGKKTLSEYLEYLMLEGYPRNRKAILKRVKRCTRRKMPFIKGKLDDLGIKY
jgi:5-methylcytosine-specific restriction endonuclease McrA